MSRKTLIRGGTVVSMDSAVGDLPRGDVLIEDDKIVAVDAEISADAEVIDATGQHRDPRIRRHPSAHVGGSDPRLRPERDAGRLLRRGARHVRARLSARGRLREQPRRLARVPQRRHHDAGRLVAHQQHPRAPGCRCPSPAGDRHPGPVRLRQRQHVAGRVLVRQRDRDPRRRRTPGPRHVLLLRRRPADDGAGDPRAGLLPGAGGPRGVGAGARARHPDHRACGDGPAGRPVRRWSSSSATWGCSGRTRPTCTAVTSATRSGSWSRRAAAGSRSRRRSRCRWATAGRRC